MSAATNTPEPTQYPEFWDEEGLRRAIYELQTRRMTSDEYYQFARMVAKNAEAVYAEQRRLEEVKQKAMEEGREEGREEGINEAKRGFITLGLQKGLAPQLVADISKVSLDFVLIVQQQLASDGR